MKFSDFHDNYVKWGEMVLSDPPGGAQTVKKQTLFALCGIHDLLSFSVFSVSEKYFYAKRKIFLKS